MKISHLKSSNLVGCLIETPQCTQLNNIVLLIFILLAKELH